MKNSFKNNILALSLALLLPLAAVAAEGPAGKADGKGPSAEERKARMEYCKANPEKCRAEKKARMEQMCKDNPERCKEMKEKMDQRRAEKKAQFEQRFKGADADGNGTISQAEAQKSLPRLARRFDQLDANKDGQISREEIAAARKARFDQQGRSDGGHHRGPRPDAGKI